MHQDWICKLVPHINLKCLCIPGTFFCHWFTFMYINLCLLEDLLVRWHKLCACCFSFQMCVLLFLEPCKKDQASGAQTPWGHGWSEAVIWRALTVVWCRRRWHPICFRWLWYLSGFCRHNSSTSRLQWACMEAKISFRPKNPKYVFLSPPFLPLSSPLILVSCVCNSLLINAF